MSDAFRRGTLGGWSAWDWTATTILLVSYSWDPARDGAEALAGRRLARHLLDAGARLHVLAASRADVEWSDQHYTVTVVPSRPLPEGKLARAAEMIGSTVPELAGSWVAGAVERGLRLLESLPADTVIYGRAAPGACNVVARELARRSGRVFVAHFSDEWPSFHVRSNGRRWLAPYKWPLFAMWRRRIARDAGALTFTNPAEAHRHLGRDAGRYVDKTFIVTHLPSAPPSPDSVPNDGIFHLVHAGNLYPPEHSAAPLMRGIRQFLDDTPPARGAFRFTQAGWAHGDLPDWAARCGLESVVHVRGRLPQADVLALLQRATLLVVIDYARPSSATIMSKLPDYMNAGRPILAITSASSALSRLFNDDGGGLTAPYAQPDEIARRLGDVFRAWQHHRLDAYLPRLTARESFAPSRALGELAAAFSVASAARSQAVGCSRVLPSTGVP